MEDEDSRGVFNGETPVCQIRKDPINVHLVFSVAWSDSYNKPAVFFNIIVNSMCCVLLLYAYIYHSGERPHRRNCIVL